MSRHFTSGSVFVYISAVVTEEWPSTSRIYNIYGVYAHFEKMHLATMTQAVTRYPLFADAGHPLGGSAQVLFQDIRDPLRREGPAVSVREQDLFPSTYPESRGVGANQLLVSPCDGNVPRLASLPVRLDVGASPSLNWQWRKPVSSPTRAAPS